MDEKVEELRGYYLKGIALSTWICENCGDYIPHAELWQQKSAQAHILPKKPKRFEAVRAHLSNRLHLCVRCHADWDHSWKKAATMKVFPLAVLRVNEFAHLVPSLPKIFSFLMEPLPDDRKIKQYVYMATGKRTNRELVEILKQRNPQGRYDGLIHAAMNNQYHDFKSNDALPKMQLVKDLEVFPELGDVRELVINGEFDESMFDED